MPNCLQVFYATLMYTEDLSKQWCISVKTINETLKRANQQLIRGGALLPLSRQYHADCMLHLKRLTKKWSTDTLNDRTKSLDGKYYAQNFGNRQYFAKIYPTNSKSKAGGALDIFCREFGNPDNLTFVGSKEEVKEY